jgi:hypothetical protein
MNKQQQQHLQSCSITASKYISMFTWSHCGQWVEPSWHEKEYLGKYSPSLRQIVERGWDNMTGYRAVRQDTHCVDLRKLGRISPPLSSPYLPTPPVFLYVCMSPTSFPLSNWMAMVVRNRCSRHKGLQVHHYILPIDFSRCSTDYAWIPFAGR